MVLDPGSWFVDPDQDLRLSRSCALSRHFLYGNATMHVASRGLQKTAPKMQQMMTTMITTTAAPMNDPAPVLTSFATFFFILHLGCMLPDLVFTYRLFTVFIPGQL